MLRKTRRMELCRPAFWDRQAAEFDGDTALMKDLTDGQMERIRLSPEWAVLDAGAGTGRLTIPLARRVRTVHALDPSPAMLDLLKTRAAKEGLDNIRCLAKPLEKLAGKDLDGVDVAIASFSLFMIDIEKALRTLDGIAAESVYLFLSASRSKDDDLLDIIGRTASPWPDCVYVENILREMGIPARRDIWPYIIRQRYGSIEDAVARMTVSYGIPPENGGRLEAYLRKKLTEEAGTLTLTSVRKAAVLWWTKRRNTEPR